MRRMYDRSEVADPANHYTKTEADAKYATKAQIASVFNYKGTKATASALPASGNTVGDVWVVTDEGNELYAWNGTSWDDLGNNNHVVLSSAAYAALEAKSAITIYLVTETEPA